MVKGSAHTATSWRCENVAKLSTALFILARPGKSGNGFVLRMLRGNSSVPGHSSPATCEGELVLPVSVERRVLCCAPLLVGQCLQFVGSMVGLEVWQDDKLCSGISRPYDFWLINTCSVGGGVRRHAQVPFGVGDKDDEGQYPVIINYIILM